MAERFPPTRMTMVTHLGGHVIALAQRASLGARFVNRCIEFRRFCRFRCGVDCTVERLKVKTRSRTESGGLEGVGVFGNHDQFVWAYDRDAFATGQNQPLSIPFAEHPADRAEGGARKLGEVLAGLGKIDADTCCRFLTSFAGQAQQCASNAPFDALGLQFPDAGLGFAEASSHFADDRTRKFRMGLDEGGKCIGRQAENARVFERDCRCRIGRRSPAAGATEEFAGLDQSEDDLLPVVGLMHDLYLTTQQEMNVGGLLSNKKEERTCGIWSNDTALRDRIDRTGG